MGRKIDIYDSTLRDGAQSEGISFSVLDKLNIVRELDELGVPFIEAGNPGSNPKDRSIMGVEIPILGEIDSVILPQFGFARTNTSLDEAYYKFLKVKQLTLLLAEIENAIYRLAINVKRTQKRANALKNIMIPKYEKLTKDITNALEEKEREEFTRLKMIKNFKESS